MILDWSAKRPSPWDFLALLLLAGTWTACGLPAALAAFGAS